MNAYELADELKRCIDDGSTDLVCVCGAVNMLLEQAALIEYYKVRDDSHQKIIKEQADRIERLEAEARAKNNYLEQHCQKIDQQADRIAKLEKEKIRAYDNGYEDGQKSLTTNAKPVAWMDYLEHSDVYDLNVSGRGIPLYTTPQTKPLSGADIEQISHCYHYTYNPDYIGFARAIEERHGIK